MKYYINEDKSVRLYNGDCLNMINKLIDKGVKVDCIITDPPYNISKDNNFKTMKDRTGRNGIDFGEWDKDFDIQKISLLPQILTDDGSLIIFHSFEQYSEIKEIMEANGMISKDRLIWEKTNPMPRNRDRRYISNCEMLSWYVKKGAKWVFNRQNDKYETMVLRFPSESGGGFKRFHPTQKSVKLIEYLLKIHSNENQTILDCFIGSGSTGVACRNLNRKFIGIELDEKYFDIAVKRIKGEL